MIQMTKEIKPFLKWAGGKRQLLPHLHEHIPNKEEYTTYIEPFLGAGAVLFDLKPSHAIVNDSNSELINCYICIRDNLNELIVLLKQHIDNMHGNERDYYHEIRGWDRDDSYSSKSPTEKAARIIFLNKTCFNGLYRVNSRGEFNTSFGKYKNPKILDEPNLRNVSRFLNENNIKFFCGDFSIPLKNADDKSFIYLDPPYDPISETSSFTGYNSGGFNRLEQERLKMCIDELNERGCRLLLSNSPTTFIKDLYSDYEQIILSASRSVNSVASKRGKIDEILIKNY